MFEGLKLRAEVARFQRAQYQKAMEVMESLPDFAKDDDEGDWKALASDKSHYTEAELSDMRTQAGNMIYNNPLAKGLIKSVLNFVVGKSMKLIALDENPEVQAYWDKFARVNDFDRRAKEFVKRTLRDGEQFSRFFEPSDPAEDVLKMRFIDANEIEDINKDHSYGIETDPDDVEKVLNYYRRYKDDNGVERTEAIPGDEVMHTKIGVDSNVKRGVSYLVPVAEYITKYKGWLDDRITLNKIRTMFNLIGEVQGAGTPAEAKGKFEDVTNSSASTTDPNKKLPKSGSVLMTKGINWKFEGLNINAGDTKDDGRSILLMIAAGTNLPEYMVTGDASNASYSSTMIAESPGVKEFEDWQDFFGAEFQKIYRRVINYGIAQGVIPEKSKKTMHEFDKETATEKITECNIDTSRACQVIFPVLIHREIDKETSALQIQRQNGWVSDRTASSTLGYDYDDEKSEIEKQEIMERSEAQEKHAAHMDAEGPEEDEDE
jgi:hypothetical protein